MKYLVQDCNCEDFPCCVHADNYAEPTPEHTADDGVFIDCDSVCCECSIFRKCDVRECSDFNVCEHQECEA
jgi:hypothetical protein